MDVIQDITIVDPYTVQITLKQFDPVFPLRMAGYQQGYIVSKAAALEFGDRFGWKPGWHRAVLLSSPSTARKDHLQGPSRSITAGRPAIDRDSLVTTCPRNPPS